MAAVFAAARKAASPFPAVVVCQRRNSRSVRAGFKMRVGCNASVHFLCRLLIHTTQRCSKPGKSVTISDRAKEERLYSHPQTQSRRNVGRRMHRRQDNTIDTVHHPRMAKLSSCMHALMEEQQTRNDHINANADTRTGRRANEQTTAGHAERSLSRKATQPHTHTLCVIVTVQY